MKCVIPKSLPELIRALEQCKPSGAVIAGGTDYTIELRSGRAMPDVLLYPGQVPELGEIVMADDYLRIGAMATMAALAGALEDKPEFGALWDAASGVGSPQIRNRATIAGNICKASPAGDMLPVCWMYDALVEVLSCDGSTQVIPFRQFILKPYKTVLQPGQMVTAIMIQRNEQRRLVSAFKKIGYRTHVSIARESIAALFALDEMDCIVKADIALGAVSGIPIYVPEAEGLLYGVRLTEKAGELIWPTVAKTIHDNCRETNRLYKTEAARGLVADLFKIIAGREV